MGSRTFPGPPGLRMARGCLEDRENVRERISSKSNYETNECGTHHASPPWECESAHGVMKCIGCSPTVPANVNVNMFGCDLLIVQIFVDTSKNDRGRKPRDLLLNGIQSRRQHRRQHHLLTKPKTKIDPNWSILGRFSRNEIKFGRNWIKLAGVRPKVGRARQQ